MNLRNLLESNIIKFVRFVAEKGYPDYATGLNIPPINPIIDNLLSTAIYVEGQGLEALTDTLFNDLDSTDYLNKEETPECAKKLVDNIKKLLDKQNAIMSLISLTEDLESGDGKRENTAISVASKFIQKLSRNADAEPDVSIFPLDEPEDADCMLDRQGGLVTGTVFDTWCRPSEGELAIILASPSVGKTTAMIDIGAGYIENNKDSFVIHFSEEMVKNQVVRKYTNRFGVDGGNDITKIKDMWKNLNGILAVESHSTGSSSVNFLADRVKKMVEIVGRNPDAIIVDYAGLLVGSTSNASRVESLNDIILALRGLGCDFKCPVWTGAQPQRNSSKSTRGGDHISMEQVTELPVLDLSDFAECWAMTFVADYVVSLNQSIAERDSVPSRARVFLAKVREPDCLLSRTPKTIETSIDYANSTFF